MFPNIRIPMKSFQCTCTRLLTNFAWKLSEVWLRFELGCEGLGRMLRMLGVGLVAAASLPLAQRGGREQAQRCSQGVPALSEL